MNKSINPSQNQSPDLRYRRLLESGCAGSHTLAIQKACRQKIEVADIAIYSNQYCASHAIRPLPLNDNRGSGRMASWIGCGTSGVGHG